MWCIRSRNRIAFVCACLTLAACSRTGLQLSLDLPNGPGAGGQRDDSLDGGMPAPDAGGMDGGLSDAGGLDGGVSPEAGLPIADGGVSGPPTVRVFAPEANEEVYRGELVSLTAQCEPQGTATIVSSGWELGLPGTPRVFVDGTAQRFDELGVKELTYFCRDSAGHHVLRQVVIHVVEAPYVVYDDDHRIYALRMGASPVPEAIGPAEGVAVTEVQSLAYAGANGEAVIARARIDSQWPGFGVYALYGAEPSSAWLHELSPPTVLATLEPKVAISPDGRYVSIRAQGSPTRLYRMDAHEPVELAVTAQLEYGSDAAPQFSPDGRYMLHFDDDVQLVDLESGAAPVVVVEDLSGGSQSVLRGLVTFSGDGSHVAYGLYTGSSYDSYVISVDDAMAGAQPLHLEPPSGSWVYLLHAAERVLFAAYIDASAYRIGAFDFDGALLASVPLLRFDACGNAMLVEQPDGTVTLMQDTPTGIATRTLSVPSPIGADSHFSADCRTYAMTMGADVVYWSVPEPDAPVAPLTIHRALAQYFYDLVDTPQGSYLVTLAYDAQGEPRYSVQRDGVVLASELESYAIAADGASMVFLEPVYPDYRDTSRSRFLERLLLSGPNAGSRFTLYGPVGTEGPIAIGADGAHVAFHAHPVLDSDQQDGVVEVRITNPESLTPSRTITRLLEGALEQRTATVQRIPSQRAVLIQASDDVPLASRYYTRALEEGATTRMQSIGKAYRHEAFIHPSGRTLALHNEALGADEIATVALTVRDDDVSSLWSIESSPDEVILGFGPHDDSVVVGKIDPELGLREVNRIDLSAPVPRRGIVRADAGEELRDARVVEDTGRVFFRVCDAVRCRLFFEDAGDIGPAQLSADDRDVVYAEIAPSGGWLVLRYADSLTLDVLDERDEWTVSARISAPTGTTVTFFENASAEGLLVLGDTDRDRVRMLTRGGSPRTLAIAGPFEVRVSPDNTRALLHVDDAILSRWLFAIDLLDPNAEAVETGLLPGVLGPISKSGRFVTFMDGTGATLLDTEAMVTRRLPANTYGVEFDRLERYCAYSAFDGSADDADLFIITLHDLDGAALKIARDSGGAPIWIDD